jgi:hypothetical protein
MSHFSVMVITPTFPNDEELAHIMQPWHEYECTGVLDEYVQEIDITEEAKEEYLKCDNDLLYHEVKSFEDFLKYWYDATTTPSNNNYYTLTDDGSVYKVFKRTNPNAKWDWWQVGGRWSGMLEVGYDPEKDPANMEICFLCAGSGKRNDEIGKAQRLINPDYTCNGCDGKGIRSKWPTAWVNRGNQIQVGKLDLSSIRDSKEIKAGNDYDRFYSLIGDNPLPDWDELIAKYGHKEGREKYHSYESLKILANDDTYRWVDTDDYKCSRDEFVASARNKAMTTFAFIKDGVWSEAGEMGWFGVVTGDENKDDYYACYARMLDTLPDHYWLTVIDCHI